MKTFITYGVIFAAVLVFFLSCTFHILSTNVDAVLWLDRVIDSYSNESVYNERQNTFLHGNYAPVDTENYNLHLKLLSGQVPSDIAGLYIRIGPNPISSHIGAKKIHRFDGHGMIHSIRIHGEGENLTYSNQYIHTPRYTIERKYDKSLFYNSGEVEGIVGILKTLFLRPLKLKLFGLTDMTSGPSNMNVVVLGSKIYACHEGSLPFALHWNEDNTFDSLGYELNKNSPNSPSSNSITLPMTSHPKVDIKTQKLYFTGFSSSLDTDGAKASAMYGSAYGTSSLQIVDNTELTLPSRPWIHDMMITEHYLLLLCGSILTHSGSADIPTAGDFLTFDEDVKFEIGVASKDDVEFEVGSVVPGDIMRPEDVPNSLQWFRALDSAAIMHVANSWEEVSSQNDTSIILWAPICTEKFDGSFLRKENKFHMARVVLNLKTGQIRKGTLGAEYNIDYPVLHPAYQGYRSKYIFASIMSSSIDRLDSSDNEPIGIIKYNVFEKVIDSTIYFPRGVFSGEMTPLPKEKPKEKNQKSFLPDGDSDGSDALYLVSFFFNSQLNASEWHIYDGETMSPTPVATFGVPVRVPYGFHGQWIEEEVLQSIINDF